MSYKLKVKLFITSVLLALSILPVINFYRFSDTFKPSKEAFFNIDYFIPSLQKIIFGLGFSLNPKQVVIGKEGWLYLGDQYASNITARRIGLTSEEEDSAREIRSGLAQWDKYFKSEGVKAFQVMMGPDKATIYPEYLPNWAKPSSDTRTDALFQNGDSGLIFDTRKSLIDAKNIYDQHLYYKTDTHWNDLGAWVAFDAFIQNFSAKNGLIHANWLTNERVTLSNVSSEIGGDLSNFLRLELPDENPSMSLGQQVNVTRIEFNTGEIKGNVGNPNIAPTSTPLLVINNKALNEAKVLWLRDSFGSAISPYMSASFSDVLQIHYDSVDSTSLIDLVTSFQPDYVFITAVERDIVNLNVGLRDLPPQFKIENKQLILEGELSSVQNGFNDVSIDGADYRVASTADPFVIFDFEQAVTTSERSKIAFNLQCIEGAEDVNLQIFWHKDGDPYFSESNSVRISTKTGVTIINLSMNEAWLEAKSISRLRVDLDSAATCTIFNLSELRIGF